MKKTIYILFFAAFFSFIPIASAAQTVKTCEYSTKNMNTTTFKLKFNLQKSANYYLEIDRKNSFIMDGAKAKTFDSLLNLKKVQFKNYDAAGTSWIILKESKCPEAVKYVTIKDNIYIFMGDEEKIENPSIVVGGHEYNVNSMGAQKSLELEVERKKNNNEETKNKHINNLNTTINTIETKNQEYLDYGCYDEETFKHTVKKTETGASYIVWENFDKVDECKKKLTTLSAYITSYDSSLQEYKRLFPKENTEEFDKKNNIYKNNIDNYRTFTESKGKEKPENNIVDNDINQGTEVSGCAVIPEVIRKWINNILKFIRYIALALVIALGALDFMKAAASGEPDAMKKAGQSFMKRMIAVIILFLLPMIVDFILNMINIYGVPKDNIDCMKPTN